MSSSLCSGEAGEPGEPGLEHQGEMEGELPDPGAEFEHEGGVG